MIISAIRTIRSRTRPLVSDRKPRGEAMVIASYNIHKCVGIDGKRDPGRIARVIEEIGPDIIALQEVDTRFGERKGLLDLEQLERQCGLIPVPLSIRSAAHGWHGNIVLFRKALVREVHELSLPGLEPRGALVAELDLQGSSSLRIIAAHFGLLKRSRQQQARMISELMNDAKLPTILLGDLNEWRKGPRSSLSAFGSPPSSVASFPSRLPFLALDRIIANREGLISEVEVHDTPLSRLASDHLPIWTTLSPGQ